MSISIQSETSEQSIDTAASSNEIGVQTVVKVYPFILNSTVKQANITSDKKFCSVLSLEASQNSSKFFSLLQYCPFHDIQEQNLRIIDLPRKTKLQWNYSHFSEDALKKLTLVDDDGVADLCTDMLIRMHAGKTTTYAEAETQTDLMVRPYLLEEPRVATVYYSTGTQVTALACGKRNSI